jgi:Fe-S-cluster containining protein
MDNNPKGYYSKYLLLRKEVDVLAEQLNKKHSKHIQCKVGCNFCCMDYSILPVEFYSILNHLKRKINKVENSSDTRNEKCIFLIHHQCTIYNERPVICRTHGLPLLYMNEMNEWELSTCELNFTEFEMKQFNQENTFPQDRFNSKLFMLNKEFIKKFAEVKYNDSDLIPVKI